MVSTSALPRVTRPSTSVPCHCHAFGSFRHPGAIEQLSSQRRPSARSPKNATIVAPTRFKSATQNEPRLDIGATLAQSTVFDLAVASLVSSCGLRLVGGLDYVIGVPTHRDQHVLALEQVAVHSLDRK
jgi:hypothetical protein